MKLNEKIIYNKKHKKLRDLFIIKEEKPPLRKLTFIKDSNFTINLVSPLRTGCT